MPKLKHLHISLSVEEDVSFIMEKIKSLESLNGIRVETQSDGGDSPKEEEAEKSPETPFPVEAPEVPIQDKPVKHDLDKDYILAQASRYAQQALENA
jgi:hypothetical protein